MAADQRASASACETPRGGPELRQWRKAKREELLAAREALDPELHQRRSEQVIGRLLSTFGQIATSLGTVGFYWPFRGEISALPFIDFVLSQGGSAALPVVVGKDLPLEFRFWRPGDPMAPGVYGIPHPAIEQRAEPDVLIASLVGFDTACYRLGYGGGFYDRTLAAAPNKPLTIGIGFECTRLETIYPQAYDIPMDWIVTEAATRQRRP